MEQFCFVWMILFWGMVHGVSPTPRVCCSWRMTTCCICSDTFHLYFGSAVFLCFLFSVLCGCTMPPHENLLHSAHHASIELFICSVLTTHAFPRFARGPSCTHACFMASILNFASCSEVFLVSFFSAVFSRLYCFQTCCGFLRHLVCVCAIL